MNIRLLSLLLLPALAGALDTSRWQYQAPIEMPPGSTGIAAARLTRDIYVRSRPDLGDLRVVRGADEVPYLIETRSGTIEDLEAEPVILDRSVIPGTGLQLTLDLGPHARHSRLRISTAETNFRRKVRIETGDDNHTWAVARNDGSIFDFSQGDRHMALLTVNYPTSTKRYVRVTIFGWTKTGDVRQVWSAYHHERPAERDVMETATAERSEDPKTKASILTVDLKQPGLPYDLLRLDSGPSHFYRAAELETSADAKDWRYAASGAIFQTANETSEGLAFATRHDRYLRLRIYNGDDKPIPVKSVVLEATVRLVKFRLAGAGAFHLLTGNPAANPPAYDFAAVIAREAPQPEVPAILRSPGPNPAYRPPPPPVKPWSERYPQVLYGILLIAVLIMGYITIRFMLKVKGAAN
ncbi:MAG TPA: DUF3999 family protein [Bryobacteraceae bacterium]|nr:DUF3999 family protein [Bryobacteraceae bacterium]